MKTVLTIRHFRTLGSVAGWALNLALLNAQSILQSVLLLG
jgi:hypothetical protein